MENMETKIIFGSKMYEVWVLTRGGWHVWDYSLTLEMAKYQEQLAIKILSKY